MNLILKDCSQFIDCPCIFAFGMGLQQQIYCVVGCPVSQMFRLDLAFFVCLWSPSQGFGRGRCLMVSQDVQLPFATDPGGRCQGQRCSSGAPVALGLHPRRLLFLVLSLLSFAFYFHLQLFLHNKSRQGDPNSSPWASLAPPPPPVLSSRWIWSKL